MICPKCKVKLNNDSKYCPKCGEIFNTDDVKKYSKIFETELLEVYYPNKSYKLKWYGVSLLYALFTYFYAIYRKMYRSAFLTIISILLWIFFLPRFEYLTFGSRGFLFYPVYFTLVGGLFCYLYYVLRFDKILLNKRKENLNRIIRYNPDKDKKELIKLIEEDKKGNLKGLIIAIIITILLIPFLKNISIINN